MTLPLGAMLGPYEVLALVGAGGMGQVYKARDTRLGRPVALKLLHADVATRPDRRARFESEARAISALSHPHICAVFDIGDDDGRPYLVMEWLEGETLDDRLSRGALPGVEVILWGTQVADALAHAHGAHLVHRDVKPSNVMLTATGVKLLDFGLAKAVAVDANGSSTATADRQRLTGEGVMVGTVQYMAPEQLEGKPVDGRSDIFALGTVLYEMAAGRKAFQGDSTASLIAAILTTEPEPVSAVRAAAAREPLPVALDHVVARCLAKHPDDRWQTARDVAVELQWADRPDADRPAQVARRESRGRWWRAAAITLAVVTLAGLLARVPRGGPAIRREPTRFTIAPPPGTSIGLSQNRTRFALSPDGRHVVFVGWTDGRSQLWIRSLSSLEARPLDSTDGAQAPFWSPDSRFVGYFADTAGEMRKVEMSGGPPTTICAAQSDGSATWAPDGTILFTQFRDGLYRVAAAGGTALRVTAREPGEMNHYWPQFLPDGRRFLYLATSRTDGGTREIPTLYAASLDAPGRTVIARLPSKTIVVGRYALFVRDGALMAQPIDADTLRLGGEAVRIADGVGYDKGLGNAAFDVSSTGALAYQGSENLAELVWFDRRGSVAETGWPVQSYHSLRLSPDGGRAAVDVVDRRTGARDVWIYDVSRGAGTRFTTDGYSNDGVWAPDGRQLVLSTSRSSAPALVARGFDSREEPLLNERSPLYADDWSSDGRWIAYRNSTRQTGSDLFLLPLAAERVPRPLVRTDAHEWDARFSPDSQWVAFVSNELGQPDVYVTAVSGGARTRISTGGGTSPRWRRDGRELFYAASDNRSIMAVPVATGRSFTPGVAARLFTLRTEAVSRTGLRYTAYDVTPDGARFLVGLPVGEPTASRIAVVLDWAAALTR